MSSAQSQQTNPGLPAKGRGQADTETVAGGWTSDLLGGNLPRTVGGGFLGFYLLDVAQIALGYEFFNPSSDFTLASQIVDRSAMPLIGFVLLFWPGLPLPGRAGRVWLKIVSWSALGLAALHLLLAGLTVTAGLRLYQRAATSLVVQRTNQAALFERVVAEAPTLTEDQLRMIFFELAPESKLAGKAPTGAALGADVLTRARRRIEEVHANADQTLRRLRLEQVRATGRVMLTGLLATVLFFLAWDFTPAYRARIFKQKGSEPALTLESGIARWFARTQRWGEATFALPDLEKYRWFRRLRRKFRRKDR